ncbi:MAG: helix-turn-helix domain-containing protein [Gordonia sp.]|jgi:DNA-binding NarL/FixJ family response regulator|uniref:helix-turn-helix domain-containing protein n=1 Tax=Gordonia sp. (in: high G+C Gram-positive bacteria) TaxID=84139 RepID=UPI001D339501|nr:helix-turn-helix domain-containing protein [Gordonia sp. (in: high G+C Gram-positive bacteria)]MCB1294370.1 helix-turn-helix domain-containing protein [Gordonia sp. (in: high G+C Gram-positive bacteria)]HQV20849.1 helix-turn-helix domain-containing protein [Gordonia sp. (in: high G+C Gram-positive bacteria)]
MHDDPSDNATQADSVDGESSDNLARLAADDDPNRGLGAVRALRTLADRLEEVQVANARKAGWSWQQIADILQVSRQAVHQKHANERRPRGPEGEEEP